MGPVLNIRLNYVSTISTATEELKDYFIICKEECVCDGKGDRHGITDQLKDNSDMPEKVWNFCGKPA